MRADQWNIAIVADDLTGAGDTAVQFADRGWSAVVTPRPFAQPDGQHAVVAITTGSRAASAARAEAVTADAVRRLPGVPHVYLKIDSALRGSVAAQVAGARRARPGAVAVVCSAYPAMGRTIAQGRAYADGVPLEDGPAGRDPVTAVTTSRLSELLPGSAHVPIDELAAAVRHATAGILTTDAETDTDLDQLGAVLAGLGERVIPVGSAGLAGVLAQHWPLSPPTSRPAEVTGVSESGTICILVSSQHQAARQQTARLRRAYGATVAEISPHASASAVDAGIVLLTAPDGNVFGRDPVVVADALADTIARWHERSAFAAFVLTGGDGAGALLERFGCTGISVRGKVDEGIPYGVAIGGVVDGLPMVTKAGGFGGPKALVAAVRRLRDERGATT